MASDPVAPHVAAIAIGRHLDEMSLISFMDELMFGELALDDLTARPEDSSYALDFVRKVQFQLTDVIHWANMICEEAAVKKLLKVTARVVESTNAAVSAAERAMNHDASDISYWQSRLAISELAARRPEIEAELRTVINSASTDTGGFDSHSREELQKKYKSLFEVTNGNVSNAEASRILKISTGAVSGFRKALNISGPLKTRGARQQQATVVFVDPNPANPDGSTSAWGHERMAATFDLETGRRMVLETWQKASELLTKEHRDSSLTACNLEILKDLIQSTADAKILRDIDDRLDVAIARSRALTSLAKVAELRHDRDYDIRITPSQIDDYRSSIFDSQDCDLLESTAEQLEKLVDEHQSYPLRITS